MAGQRIDIMELRTLITLKRKGLSNRKAAALLNINRKTVDGYVSRFRELGLSWDELMELEEPDLRDLFTEEGQTEKERYEALSGGVQHHRGQNDHTGGDPAAALAGIPPAPPGWLPLHAVHLALPALERAGCPLRQTHPQGRGKAFR